MNTTRAALATHRLRPARIDVRCGSRPGSFDVATQLVMCKCSACRSSTRNDPYTPPEFEAHAGKSSSKKWKVTIKISMSNSNSTLGAWLDTYGIEARTFSGKVVKRPSSPPPSVTTSAPQQHLQPNVPPPNIPPNMPPHLAAAAYYHAQAHHAAQEAQEAQAAAARNAPAPRPSPHTPVRQRLVPPTSAPPPPRKDKVKDNERAADDRPPTRRRIDVSLPSSSQTQGPTLSPRAEQINAALRAGNSPKVTGWRLTDSDRLSVSMEIGSVTFSGTIDESPQLLASAVEVERLAHVPLPLPMEAVVFVAGNERMVIPHTFFNEDEFAWAMYRLGRHSTWMRRYSTWLLTQRDNV